MSTNSKTYEILRKSVEDFGKGDLEGYLSAFTPDAVVSVFGIPFEPAIPFWHKFDKARADNLDESQSTLDLYDLVVGEKRGFELFHVVDVHRDGRKTLYDMCVIVELDAETGKIKKYQVFTEDMEVINMYRGWYKAVSGRA
ncbi:hypothetical protein M427DRAFT_39077 [Gonapodya prolifera JEL478]|uniref:SnoaL-like domain-containing protein n=1 Tax=Gonapodya prolifera (strain JEL478) TaxID=1344416 RepID=A0A138ZZ15_GONPJ|nr:hypothetical protein M427DRAFT_39077 [Gonapodya prolifera JEL478]|eukprot:KXS09373.1 hypothetical protein M427DRAFT_39077 [Gonapodya prolifera JEL478]